jgi:hypothetical protein
MPRPAPCPSPNEAARDHTRRPREKAARAHGRSTSR